MCDSMVMCDGVHVRQHVRQHGQLGGVQALGFKHWGSSKRDSMASWVGYKQVRGSRVSAASRLRHTRALMLQEPGARQGVTL